jgi:hypothetical protein
MDSATQRNVTTYQSRTLNPNHGGVAMENINLSADDEVIEAATVVCCGVPRSLPGSPNETSRGLSLGINQ